MIPWPKTFHFFQLEFSISGLSQNADHDKDGNERLRMNGVSWLINYSFLISQFPFVIIRLPILFPFFLTSCSLLQ